MKALIIHPSALVRGVAPRVLESLGAEHIVEAKTVAEGIVQA